MRNRLDKEKIPNTERTITYERLEIRRTSWDLRETLKTKKQLTYIFKILKEKITKNSVWPHYQSSKMVKLQNAKS